MNIPGTLLQHRARHAAAANLVRAAALLVVICTAHLGALAQPALANVLAAEDAKKWGWSIGDVVLKMYATNAGSGLCPPAGEPYSAELFITIRNRLIAELRKSGSTTLSGNDVAHLMLTRFPCPFSPYRDELRPATKEDIEGAWLFPEASQHLRFPPAMPLLQESLPYLVKCEALGYASDGEQRIALLPTQATCPVVAKEVLRMRQGHWRYTWKLLAPGRLQIESDNPKGRTDEWDVHVAVSPFKASGVQFEQGDLLQFQRVPEGPAVNVAMTFKHLRRLTDVPAKLERSEVAVSALR